MESKDQKDDPKRDLQNQNPSNPQPHLNQQFNTSPYDIQSAHQYQNPQYNPNYGYQFQPAPHPSQQQFYPGQPNYNQPPPFPNLQQQQYSMQQPKYAQPQQNYGIPQQYAPGQVMSPPSYPSAIPPYPPGQNPNFQPNPNTYSQNQQNFVPPQNAQYQQQIQSDLNRDYERLRVKRFRQVLDKHYKNFLSPEDRHKFEHVKRLYNFGFYSAMLSLPLNFYFSSQISKKPEQAGRLVQKSLMTSLITGLWFAYGLYRYTGETRRLSEMYLLEYSPEQLRDMHRNPAIRVQNFIQPAQLAMFQQPSIEQGYPIPNGRTSEDSPQLEHSQQRRNE